MDADSGGGRKKIRGISLLPEQWNEKVRDLECWVRKIELTCEGGMLLSEEKQNGFCGGFYTSGGSGG